VPSWHLLARLLGALRWEVVVSWELLQSRDVLMRALDAGLVEPPRISARALARAAGVAHWTAARWVRGDRMAPETDRKLRAVLGLNDARA
jgi:hypothetical protein